MTECNSWNGRQLSSLQQNDNVVYYTYDSDGIRTSKTVNGVETTYQLDGTKIVSETTDGNIKWFIYDENDSIIGFEYYNQVYYFEKNAQGDVVRIFDSEGNFVSEYFYDAWGILLPFPAIRISQIPIRSVIVDIIMIMKVDCIICSQGIMIAIRADF